MNAAECAELLRRIAHVDRYAAQPSTDLALGWAAMLDDIGLDEALDACRTHYRATTDTIAVGNIVALVRARRRDAIDRAAVPSQAPDPTLLRRIEAIADAKAVDADRTPAIPAGRGPGRRDRAADAVADAMRRGEQAREQHQREAGTEPA